MNKKQRIAILVGTVLVALILLFPTYNVRRYEGGKFMGMGLSKIEFVFDPPSFAGDYYGREATVDLSSLLLRILLVVVLTGGVVFYLADGQRTPTNRT